jgi:hypothetical protein
LLCIGPLNTGGLDPAFGEPFKYMGVSLFRVTWRPLSILFWQAFASGTAAAILGPSLNVLKRHAGELGPAFAATLVVHISLMIWLN